MQLSAADEKKMAFFRKKGLAAGSARRVLNTDRWRRPGVGLSHRRARGLQRGRFRMHAGPIQIAKKCCMLRAVIAIISTDNVDCHQLNQGQGIRVEDFGGGWPWRARYAIGDSPMLMTALALIAKTGRDLIYGNEHVGNMSIHITRS
jgi:hypothetical protein